MNETNQRSTPSAPADATAPLEVDQRAQAAVELTRLSYEGHKLPVFVILIWVGFLVFGLTYFVRHLL